MQAEGPLLVIAEVAIALAGFASIVVAIRGTTPSNWTRQDRFGLVNVFVPSVSVFFCALFPFPLYLTGWDEPTVWRVSSGLFGSTTLCYLVVLSVRQWGVAPRVPLLFWFFVASGYVLGATMMSLAFGVVFDAGPRDTDFRACLGASGRACADGDVSDAGNGA